MDENDKRAIAESVSKMYSGIERNVDEGRLKSMPDTEFEREVDELSIEILKEIGELKKRYYEEGFKDALKQLQAQQIVASSLYEHEHAHGHKDIAIITTAAPAQAAQAPTPAKEAPTQAPEVDYSHFDSKMEDLDQKLEEYSARIAALEQMVLTYGSRDEELKQVIGENKELVNTLKDRLTEISMIQTSIEEKIMQPPAEQPAPGVSEEQFSALRKDIDHLGELIVEDSSKMNRIENSRKASVRRLDRKFKALEKRLEDFKKVRRQIRKQGKRITKLSDEAVAKTSFTTTVKRLRAAKAASAKARPRKVRAKAGVKVKTIGVSGGRRKQVAVRTKLAAKPRKATGKRAKAAKPKVSRKTARKAASKAPAVKKSTVTVSSAAPTTVEINQKK